MVKAKHVSHNFLDKTWKEVAALHKTSTVVILPIGSIEAHGPHLPIGSDIIFAQSVAEACANQLPLIGLEGLIFPPVAYSTSGFAKNFPGTISFNSSLFVGILLEIIRALSVQGFKLVLIANMHFDPENINGIKTAIDVVRNEAQDIKIIFPDLTQKPFATQLSEEFKSGACHAGQFETSMMLAAAPELVRENIRQQLFPNPQSLSKAIKAGKKCFEDAGGMEAYFGFPAQATREEGEATITTIGSILCETVFQEINGII